MTAPPSSARAACLREGATGELAEEYLGRVVVQRPHLGSGRIIAWHRHSAVLYRIHQHIRLLCF
jgi:hypothetical protein